MFSLIVTLISIALVAMLAVASLYYAGRAFVERSHDNTASRILNEGMQLHGAYTLSRVRAESATSIDDLLAEQMLVSIPTGWTEDGVSYVHGSAAQPVHVRVCERINARFMQNTVGPFPDDATTEMQLRQVGQYIGCVQVNGVAKVFFLH